MDRASPLAFFKAWMVVIGVLVIVAAVAHKRGYFRPAASASLIARIVTVSAFYLVPAAVAWVIVVGFGMRVLAERGHSVSSGLAVVIGSLGCWVIGSLLLGKEIEMARKLPPRG